jgi:hypothetical protein
MTADRAWRLREEDGRGERGLQRVEGVVHELLKGAPFNNDAAVDGAREVQDAQFAVLVRRPSGSAREVRHLQQNPLCT